MVARIDPRWRVILALGGWLGAGAVVAQSATGPGLADYTRAENMLRYNTEPLVDQAISLVNWLDDGQFWYREHDQSGDHFYRYDAVHGQKSELVDRDKLAAALAPLVERPLNSKALPLTAYAPQADGRLALTVRGKRYLCAADLASCAAAPAAGKEPGVLSPDGRQEAFIRDWNLWLRDSASGAERQLTHDGVSNDGYATDNAGWKHTNNAILVWSPDSKRIATFQQDQRKTGDMYLVSTQVGHPKLEAWKYPLVGDANVTMIERVVIDVDSGKLVRFNMPPDQHRSSLCDDISCGPDGGWDDVKWAPDGRSLAFVSTSRDHKQEWFRVADPDSGAVRTVFSESVPTYFESGNGRVNWQYLPASKQVVWFSERSNWGQLYLYDLTSGKQQAQLTRGDGNVTEVLRVDPASHQLWFRGVGKERGWDPYYQAFYKIGLDGKGLTLLTPEPADHTVTLSPNGSYFVDSYSTPTTPPVVVLRRASDGKPLAQLARTDISRLRAAGWVAPQPFTVKGRDGKSDLYGLLFKPSHFDPAKKYPVVDYVYPGPQTGSVGSRSFLSARVDHQALAELGFVVVTLDGMGTPWRSKAFHDAYFQHIEDNTMPDQVTGLRQLGQRYPWIDLGRVGIWGHSGGGNATVGAMFHYADFFKVGWAESGNHDNRDYEDDWAEKWQGLLVKGSDGKSNYDAQANENFASDLKGHLMIVHGTMDDNVPPYESLLVVDALIKANKDFDLLVLPNAHHGYADRTPYVTRRRWDYFVRYLQGATPPVGYAMKPMPAP